MVDMRAGIAIRLIIKASALAKAADDCGKPVGCVSNWMAYQATIGCHQSLAVAIASAISSFAMKLPT
jgi:hypothetical protein